MSTSKLQREVKKRIRSIVQLDEFLENTRPPWLVTDDGIRLELDFYFEKQSIAIEVQGKQHFCFSPGFHKSQSDFIDQLNRDRKKKELCKKNGVCLLEICGYDDIDSVMQQVIDSQSKWKSIQKFREGIVHPFRKQKSILNKLLYNRKWHIDRIEKIKSKMAQSNDFREQRLNNLSGAETALRSNQIQIEQFMQACSPSLKEKILRDNDVKYSG